MIGGRESAGRSAFWAVMGQGAGQGLSLLMFLVIARFVSKESFGIVAVCLASMECLRRVLIDPLTSAVTAKPDVEVRDFDVCFSLLVLISLAVTMIVIVFASPIAHLIGSPAILPALRPTALILLAFGLSGAQGAWLVRSMRFRALAIRSVASVLIGGMVGIGMALRGFGVWSLVAQQLTINIVNVIVLWGTSGWRPRWTLTWPDAKAGFRSARHISLGAIWNSLANDADIFFASAYFGPAAAGIYNAGKRIMLSANLILVNTISAVTLPVLANLRHHQERGASFLEGLRFTSVATAPAFAGLAAAAPDLVRVILGPDWAEVAYILMGLASGGYALSIGQFATSVLLVGQRSHLDSMVSAISAVSNIVTFLLVVRFGPVALAAAASLTAFVVTPIRMRFALIHLGLRWGSVVMALLPSVVASLVMGAALIVAQEWLPLPPSPYLRLVAILAGGAAFYGMALWLFAPGLFHAMASAAGRLIGLGRPARQAEPR